MIFDVTNFRQPWRIKIARRAWSISGFPAGATVKHALDRSDPVRSYYTHFTPFSCRIALFVWAAGGAC